MKSVWAMEDGRDATLPPLMSSLSLTALWLRPHRAGPAIVLSFLYASFASLMSAFCYAEFAARIPVSGSAYTFAYVTVGEIIGWLIGWNLTLEYALSASGG